MASHRTRLSWRAVWAVPALLAAGAIAINERGKFAIVKTNEKNITIKEGDWVSIDGTTGDVYLGQAKTKDPDPNSPIFAKFMKMADEFRGNFGVRANADIPRDAKVARAFGAEGIGLCRTEHMFFAEDRLPLVQAMILADDEKDRRKALAKLLPMQRKDFAGLFEAMDGFPVVIRTLDPPLHEFVPKREELMVDIARLPYADIKAKKEMAGALRQLWRRSREPEERSAGSAEARRRAARVQPDARPSRLPSRYHVSRDHRDAGARHLRGCRAGREEGQEGYSRSHDSADRHREGAREPEGDREARSGRSAGQGRLEGPALYDRHDDRDSARRPARRPGRSRKPSSSASARTTSRRPRWVCRATTIRSSQTEYEEMKIFKADPFGALDQEGVGKLIEWLLKLAARPVPISKSVSAASTAVSPVRWSSAIAWA